MRAPTPPANAPQVPSPEGWIDAALRLGRKLAFNRASFTTDELWRALEKEGWLATAEPRAMGHVMLQLSKRNLIRSSGRYSRSERPTCHSRPVLIWESQVY